MTNQPVSDTSPLPNLTEGRYKGCLFDMDGVLTDTASVHAKAWKEAFDELLETRAREYGTDFVPFDLGADYHQYVDGKPRDAGVRDFLASRGISLPHGSPTDPAGDKSIWAVGNRKNDRFLHVLDTEGATVYEGSVQLVRQLRAEGIHTGVVSSSANTAAILASAGIDDLFEVRVDGTTIIEEGIPGKPAPDTFVEAARRLGLAPAEVVVFEDALAGVAAGRAGGFGLVVGVDRVGQTDQLLASGADIVIRDLSELIHS